ncbi:hypothetical protein PFISCL1PPCAC_13492, partial [Pristionchus fissidentatus]
TCLICEAEIAHINMGIDACRACAVFYRRTKQSKGAIRCRRNTGDCAKEGKVLECRRCRYDHMRSIIERSQLTTSVEADSSTVDQESASSSVATCADLPSTSSGTPLIDRMRLAYNVMTRVRKCAELSMRPADKFVHPKNIDNDTYKFIPATHGLASRAAPVLLSGLFNFASFAFPEFDELPTSERWFLVRGCFERIHIIESSLRSVKEYPNDETVFISYTMTLAPETIDHFLSDCDPSINTDAATRICSALRRNLEQTAGSKATMRRVNPNEDEFLALLALAFWNDDTTATSDSLTRMATSNRDAIMKELHAYYSASGRADYATRIGELFCLLVSNESVATAVVEDIELLRLLDLFRDTKYY